MSGKKISLSFLFLFAIAAFLFQGFIPSESGAKGKMIGLQLYSVKDDMKKDVAGTLASVGEMGYKFVETAGYSDGKIYGLNAVEFKKLCKKNGLKFLGAHTGQDAPTEANWDKTMEWWDVCVAAHKAAGVKWIVQPWMGKAAYKSLDGLKHYCKYFNAVGEKCNAAGIRFGYHNHAQEFTKEFDGKPVFDWMMELTDPEKVMFQLDLYWIVEGKKDPLKYFEKYAGRFELWHIKDKAEVGESGNMDFASMFAKRKQSGAEYGIVEVEEYHFTPLESCKKSLEYLNAADFVDL